MSSTDRYLETVATIPQNGYSYKDYYIKFDTDGNKMFQTFGSKDSILYIFDTQYNLLVYNDDDGYRLNAMFNYTVEANKPYILRVKFYSNFMGGDVKVSITPALIEYSTYGDITTNKSAGGFCYYFVSSLNSSCIMTFTPTVSGTYTFESGYVDTDCIDTYLYLVDPHTTNMCLYNDDGAGNLQAIIKTDLIEGRTYFIVLSSYNIVSTAGRLILTVNKVS